MNSGSMFDKSKHPFYKDYIMSYLGIIDQIKNWCYLLFYPHTYFGYMLLILNRIVPYACAYGVGLYFNKAPQEVVKAYFGLWNYEIILRETLLNFIGLVEHLPFIL